MQIKRDSSSVRRCEWCKYGKCAVCLLFVLASLAFRVKNFLKICIFNSLVLYEHQKKCKGIQVMQSNFGHIPQKLQPLKLQQLFMWSLGCCQAFICGHIYIWTTGDRIKILDPGTTSAWKRSLLSAAYRQHHCGLILLDGCMLEIIWVEWL